jgi:hypothetical protein
VNEQKNDHYTFVKRDESFRQRIAIASFSKSTQTKHREKLFNINDKFCRETIHHIQISESHDKTHQNRHKSVAEIIHVVNFVCFLQRESSRMMHQSRRKHL